MNILLFNLLYSIILSVLLYTFIFYTINLVDKENREITDVSQKILNIESTLKGLSTLPLTILIVWILISISTGAVIKDIYKKDKSIAILETKTVDNIKYTVDKYEIDNKYIVNSNNVHIIYGTKPYIKYIKRVQIGPLYYDTNSGIELYITEDIANKVQNIKEDNMVYISK